MVDLDLFLNANKSMIVAPAGYGKTHTIIEVLRGYDESKKILVLTHTHAGIASIREKAKKEHIDPAKYTLDTISSFALFLTNSYVSHKESMPLPEDKSYFPFATSMSIKLLNSKPIRHYLTCAYSHLIVDEYQDCTLLQHEFILKLSEILKTHLLGDPLQGIFDFNEIVDMDSSRQMKGFIENVQILEEPWRWKGKNEQLGNELAEIRKLFEREDYLDVTNFKGISFQSAIKNNDIYDPQTNVSKNIVSYINQTQPDSLLVIVPEKHNVHPIASRFQKQFGIREINAFDDEWYYESSKSIDSNDGKNALSIVRLILLDIFPKTVIDKWINDQGKLKVKRKIEDCDFYNHLSDVCLNSEKNIFWFINIIKIFKNQYYRQCNIERANAILNAVRIAASKSISVYEGMKQDRDVARRVGRKVYGRYVGTTLLTKGLEFDTVIILNPNDFVNKKHLYVAFTRAVRKLIVISTSNIISVKR